MKFNINQLIIGYSELSRLYARSVADNFREMFTCRHVLTSRHLDTIPEGAANDLATRRNDRILQSANFSRQW